MSSATPAPLVIVSSRSFGTGSVELAARVAHAGYRVERVSPVHDLRELRPLLPEAAGWIAGTGPVTAKHLALAPRLRVIARYGVGVDAVDVPAATAAGVVVTNTPGANSSAVAEHTIALMLATLRGIPAADRRVRRGDWSGWSTRELSSLTVGIVGLGRIGRGVADRLSAFGARLLGADPWLPDDSPAFGGLERADGERMAHECDIVTLHAPGGDRVIDAGWLAADTRRIIIVNTARADLIDEDAVAAAIRSGRVTAYATDMLASENDENGASPLLAEDLADHVTVTAHLGAQTVESVDRMGTMATENLLAVLAGGEAPDAVNTPS